MSRVLYVSQYFVSADQPGGVRHWQHTRALARAGHDVTVVSSYVQHKERDIPERYRKCTLSGFNTAHLDPKIRDTLVRARRISQQYVERFVNANGRFCESGLIYIGPPGIGKHLAQGGRGAPAGVDGDAIAAAAHVKEADGGQVAVQCLGDKVADAVLGGVLPGETGHPRHRGDGGKGRVDCPPDTLFTQRAEVGQLAFGH